MDINDLKEATEHPDSSGYLWWGDSEDPEATISWAADGSREIGEETRVGALRFEYTLTNPRTDESEKVEYTVSLDYTECNFGGVRPWFRCPQCYDRRGKLHLPPKGGDSRFLCRECYDLGYRSSRTSGDDLKQAELRYRRAFAKADKDDRRPHPNNRPLAPERPNGMHHATFHDLKQDLMRAEMEWTDEMIRDMKQILARYDTMGGRPTPLAGFSSE
jgi:hypothetical protein